MEAAVRGAQSSSHSSKEFRHDDGTCGGSQQNGQNGSCPARAGLHRAPVSHLTTLLFAFSYLLFGAELASSASVSTGNEFMEFDMTSTTKCIMEDIGQNVIVVGNYAGIRKADRTPVYITAKVQDPKGKVLYSNSAQEEAQFAFTAATAGDYRACFSVNDMETALATTIRLDWKTGVSASNWDDIAKKENLDTMATELRKLEQVVKEIHEEMLFFRTREEEMRNLNEATNDRVAFFSVCSLLVCVGLGAWQLWHLKSFFHRKKLL